MGMGGVAAQVNPTLQIARSPWAMVYQVVPLYKDYCAGS